MTKKFHRLMLAALVTALAFSAPARAEPAKDMKPGTWTGEGGHRWLKFGEHVWRVLDVFIRNNRKVAFLLTNDT